MNNEVGNVTACFSGPRLLEEQVVRHTVRQKKKTRDIIKMLPKDALGTR